MDKSLVVAYTRISPELKRKLLDLGKKHGHAQTREGKARLSTVIRWGLTEWVETKRQQGKDSEIAQLQAENLNLRQELFEPESPEGQAYQSEVTKLQAQITQLQADLASTRHRAVSLSEVRPS